MSGSQGVSGIGHSRNHAQPSWHGVLAGMVTLQLVRSHFPGHGTMHPCMGLLGKCKQPRFTAAVPPHVKEFCGCSMSALFSEGINADGLFQGVGASAGCADFLISRISFISSAGVSSNCNCAGLSSCIICCGLGFKSNWSLDEWLGSSRVNGHVLWLG